jgi:hypothetical protein
MPADGRRLRRHGNVLDTAINYRGGASEEILGALLDGRRDRFVLSTKYTVSRDPTDPNAADNHRKNLVLSLETSLGRSAPAPVPHDVHAGHDALGARRRRRRRRPPTAAAPVTEHQGPLQRPRRASTVT